MKNSNILIFDNSITSRSKFNTGIQRTVRNLQCNLDGKLVDYFYIKFTPINESWFDKFDPPELLSKNHVYSIFLHLVSIFFHFIQFIKLSPFGRVISSFIFFIKTFSFLFQHKINRNKIYFVFSDSNWTRRGYFFLFINKKLFNNKNLSIFYDLGPYIYPEFFDNKLVFKFKKFWNKSYKLIDIFICISESVKSEVCSHWGLSDKVVLSFNLGSDLPVNNHVAPLYKVTKIQSYKNFLVLGSIEPRKNNEYILENFTKLLDENKPLSSKIRLIFIYNNSWKSENFFNNLYSSNYYNKNIFLQNNISDSELKNFFNSSYALVNSSIYEGYGLGLQEALNYNLKIFCSNIPVFKELFNKNAIFFDLANPNDLYNQILNDHKNFKSFTPKKNKIISWNKSASNLIKIIKDAI